MRRSGPLLFASFFVTAGVAAGLHAQDSDSAFAREQYVKSEYRIPMRDGVQLFTIVYAPKDAAPERRYPILLSRTPYAAGPYGPDTYRVPIGPNPFMMREKY